MDILINITAFLAIPIGAIMTMAGMATIGKDDALGIALSMIGPCFVGCGLLVLRSN